jgi:hypothetical protein
MSSQISASLVSSLLVLETFQGPYVSPTDATAGFGNQLAENITLNGDSSPAASEHAEFQKAMVSGAGTIDLTAMPGKTVNETINGTGLKVQMAKFRALATNANPITIVKGASNGYALLGASMNVTLLPGQSQTLNLDGAAPTIGSGAKTLDISGTGTQVLEVELVMG